MADRIVIAEDEAQLRGQLSAMLRQEGFEVFEATDGRAALALIRLHDPDLVLSDLTMPEMSGHDLVREIREYAATSHIPTVLLTTAADHDAARQAMNRGADDYLIKPVRREQLLACIHSRITNSKLQRATSQRLARQAHRLSHFDGVTDLPNRTHFLLLLGDLLEIEMAQDEPMLWAVALDNMPELTQIFGARQLDDWLYQLSQRLLQASAQPPFSHGARCTVARIGDDRFALLMPRWDDSVDLESAATELLELMQLPVLSGLREQYPRVVVAVYPAQGDKASAESMLSRLEFTLARARARQPRRVGIYRPELTPELSASLRLHNDIHRAVQRNELRAVYQPQRDAKSGLVVGFEALLRWQHPGLGLLAPASFIAQAEDNGQIVGMGAWMLKQACAQVQAWQGLVAAGNPALRVAVNLSARQFGDRQLARHIDEALQESGLPAHLLELEITESTAMLDLQHSLDLLRRFKAMGLSLAIDDFGTGYSSLAYLKRFPLDVLKLDQSFVQHLCTDAEDQAIAGAIVNLAHSLDLKVIAEGVETWDQHKLLVQMGCDETQGYLHGKPMAADQVPRWMGTQGGTG